MYPRDRTISVCLLPSYIYTDIYSPVRSYVYNFRVNVNEFIRKRENQRRYRERHRKEINRREKERWQRKQYERDKQGSDLSGRLVYCFFFTKDLHIFLVYL